MCGPWALCVTTALLLRRCSDQVVVVTSDKMGAGTDANVFIDIFGMDGTHTGRMLLNNKGNDFERGQTDTYQVGGLGCAAGRVYRNACLEG